MNNIFKIRTIATLFCLFSLTCCQTTEQILIEKTPEIAIMMPLSGPEGKLGHRLANFIELGLEDNLQTNIKLIKYDASNNSAAQEMMKKILESNTKIILGPLLSSSTKAIEKTAIENDITIISLSNNPELANSGNYVFGHSPMSQSSQLLKYISNIGYQNVILFLPQNHYLAENANNLKQIIHENSKNTTVETMTYNMSGLNQSMLNLNQMVDDINENSYYDTKPIIFLADKTENLLPIIDQITANNIDKKAILIGDNRSNIYTKNGCDLIFTGGYYDNKIDDLKQKMNVNHLTFMDLLAYDLGKVAAYSIGENYNLTQFRNRLNSLSNFPGYSGITNIDGKIAQRRYDIIRRQNNEYTLISE